MQGWGEQGWQVALGRLLEEVMFEPRLEGGEGGLEGAKNNMAGRGLSPGHLVLGDVSPNPVVPLCHSRLPAGPSLAPPGVISFLSC